MELFDRTNAPGRSDTWYVYALVDSRTPEEIRYIGITNHPRRRLGHHCSQALDSHTRKARWVAKVMGEGGGVLMRVITSSLSHVDAKACEIDLIARHRDMGDKLTNLTDGGDGTSGRVYSAQTREKIASSRRGKPLTIEARALLSVANTGRTSPNKGKTLTPEWRRNISLGGIRRMRNPTVRQQISEQNTTRYSDAGERSKTAVATRMSGPPSNNASGYKGVSFCGRTKKWVAQIKDVKRRMIGRFLTPEEAARAYDKAAYAAWGSECYLNFPADMAA